MSSSETNNSAPEVTEGQLVTEEAPRHAMGSLPGHGDLGKYQLIAELGHGGMADVFRAVARGPEEFRFNKLLAVKQLRPHLADDKDFVALFLEEARIAARLNHPNIVQTNDVGRDGNRLFLVMEYLEGQPLSRAHSRSPGGLPIPLLLRVLSDTLCGMHYAHELADFDGSPLQLVHRDVSPHNVFVTYDGIVKVLDFGVAKTRDGSVQTQAGVLKGKLDLVRKGSGSDLTSLHFAHSGQPNWTKHAVR